MADEKRGASRRKRAPATIDLTATEIAAQSAGPEAASPETEPPAAAPEPEPLMQDAAASAPTEPKTEASASDAAPPGEAAEAQRPSRARSWPAATAATFAGAVAGALVFAGLWFAGPRALDHAPADVASKIAALEARLSDVANRPTPPAADARAVAEMGERVQAMQQLPRRVDDLEARLAKAEAAVAAVGATPAELAADGRLSALEGVTQSYTATVADLARRAEEANAAAREARQRSDAAAEAARKAEAASAGLAGVQGNLDAMAARIDALERAERRVAEELSKPIPGLGRDREVRVALLAGQLRAAVERGDPYATELAALRPLVTDAALLEPLAPFAASGVPSAAALGRELEALAAAMTPDVSGASSEGGLLDRLQASAGRLVRVRPVGEAVGDGPASVVARIEAKAAQRDIAGALAELRKAPEPVRAPAAAWITKAEQRAQVLDAARRLAAEAHAALGAPPP